MDPGNSCPGSASSLAAHDAEARAHGPAWSPHGGRGRRHRGPRPAIGPILIGAGPVADAIDPRPGAIGASSPTIRTSACATSASARAINAPASSIGASAAAIGATWLELVALSRCRRSCPRSARGRRDGNRCIQERNRRLVVQVWCPADVARRKPAVHQGIPKCNRCSGRCNRESYKPHRYWVPASRSIRQVSRSFREVSRGSSVRRRSLVAGPVSSFQD